MSSQLLNLLSSYCLEYRLAWLVYKEFYVRISCFCGEVFSNCYLKVNILFRILYKKLMQLLKPVFALIFFSNKTTFPFITLIYFKINICIYTENAHECEWEVEQQGMNIFYLQEVGDIWQSVQVYMVSSPDTLNMKNTAPWLSLTKVLAQVPSQGTPPPVLIQCL